jgi:serine/threonine protein kinase
MSSTPPASSLVPGLALDRYELLAPIAQGGMAQVWVARLTGKLGFERLCAVKTVIGQHSIDEKFIKMFLDEARIISLIRHPNVAQVLDLGQHHEILYLVLEWIDGDSMASLRRLVHGRGEKIPLGIVLKVVADSCAGLHAAHELKNASGQSLNVVHRDVSPSNILVSPSGEIKVIDFGVAKSIDRISDETAAGVIKGKVAYMSPEQALGKAVDRRADIWSCGIMLYHLLAGRTPYEAENQISTLHRVVQGLPPEPIRGVPPEITEIAYTALSYSADARYATADEMQRALETAMMKVCGPTTQADVASYVSTKLADRITRRKRVITRALEAAEQRHQLQAEFESAIEKSSSSMLSVRELRTPASIPGITPPPISNTEAIDQLLRGSGSSPGTEKATAAPVSPEPSPAAAPSPVPPAPSSHPPVPSAPPPGQRTEPQFQFDPARNKLPSWEPPPGAVGPLPPPPRAPGSTPPPKPPMPNVPALKLPPPPAVPDVPGALPSPPPARPEPIDLAIPEHPIVTAADDPLPRGTLSSLSDVSKFGTRRRGPMIAIGVFVMLLFVGYAAYLAWDRINNDKLVAPPPSANH